MLIKVNQTKLAVVKVVKWNTELSKLDNKQSLVLQHYAQHSRDQDAAGYERKKYLWKIVPDIRTFLKVHFDWNICRA